MKNKKIIYIILTFVLLYLIVTGIRIWKYGYIDEKQKCDVAIVLGASSNINGVSPVYAERINHGIWLYNNDFVDYIILTGGIGEENNFSDASKAKEYALDNGIPQKAIVLEEKSKITQENLKNSKEIMQERGFQTCIIVSDPLHMKRAMCIAKDYEITAYSSPTTTTKYLTLKTKLPFLLREEFFYIGYNIYRLFF